MALFERVSLWIAAITGAVFAAGSFYISLAQPFKWWPFQAAITTAASAKGAIMTAPPVPAWILVGLGLIGLALLATVLSFRVKKPQRFTPSESAFLKGYQTLQQVFNQAYQNQTVHLDGKEFCECKFGNCTLIFEGRAPVRFTNVKFEGEVQFGGLNPVIQNTISLLMVLSAASGATGVTLKRLETDAVYPKGK